MGICFVWPNIISGGEDQVLELWRGWNTPSLPLLSGPLWPGVVVLVKVTTPYDHHYVILLTWISLTLSLSFAIHLYHTSLPPGFPGHILCPYSAVVDKFSLVVLQLCIRVKGSIGERHLWVCFCSSSSVLHVCLSNLDGLWDSVGSRKAAVLWDVASW